MVRKMKQNIIRAVLVCAAAALLGGCVYAKTRMPLDTDFDKTALGSKTGRSQFHTVAWLVSWGDGGTKAAADNGAIVTINHADREYLNILFGVYSRVTTVVYGD